MANQEIIRQLKSYLKKIQKEQKITPVKVRTIIRVKSLIAYYKGNSVGKVSQCFDINEKSLKRWIKRYENGGVEALNDEERSGCPVRLPKEQQQELKKMIEEQNQRVWVARHVYEVLVLIFGVTYSVKYIPAVLRGMGLSYHKAVHVLIKRDNEKRRQWIQEKLPEIYGKKIEEGWRIFYQDEAGVQTDGTLTYTWGPEGEKTEIENYGRHGRVNFFGAFELGTGIFYGIVTSFKLNNHRLKTEDLG
jgi:transposase